MPIQDKQHIRPVPYYCFRCTSVWRAEPGSVFQGCPVCSRTDWDTEEGSALCRSCGNEWDADRQDSPCPACGTPRNLRREGGGRNCRCLRCGHAWIRKAEGLPDKCPVCRNPSWNERGFHDHVCMSCGHRWRNGTESPRRCPSCRSVKWNSLRRRLQCRRCGHRWRTYRESSSEVRMCPSCKSTEWDQSPAVRTCLSCRSLFTPEPGSRTRVCQTCMGKGKEARRTCPFCDTVWNSPGSGRICPNCGVDIVRESKETMPLWSDGTRKLVYSKRDGSDTVYLFREGVPIASKYLSDVLDILGLTLNAFMNSVNRHLIDEKLDRFALIMEMHRDDYLGDIPYFMDRLKLGEEDAKILALHFTSMGPEAISLYLGIPSRQVRRSFDRIMEAYAEVNIVVDDSVYTADPFAEYRRQLGE